MDGGSQALATSPTPRTGGTYRRAPGPAGDPLLGSLRELRSDPLRLFVEGAARYGDLVRYRVAHRQAFLVVGPELIAQVGIHNRENYVKGVSYDALRIPIGDALLTADGPLWRSRRTLLLPVFSRRNLLDQIPAMAAAVDSLSDRWEGLAARDGVINLASEMNRLAFDVVGRVLMGSRLGEQMARLEPLIEGASDWVARRTRALVPVPPSLPTPRNRRYRRAEAGIRAFAERLISNRREAGDRSDMVSLLIAARDESGEPMDPIALRDEVIGFLMAGHQTTGAALAWTWHLLGRHEAVDARLAVEAASVLGTRTPRAEDLDRLIYTGQVLDESIRLYPPGWAFTRTPLADDELAGHAIPAGSVVIVSSYANQRNPRFWDSPEAFDPDRFGPDAPAPAPYHYFPFGIGAHACIGKHLALIEAKVAVAMLARRYRLELLSPEPVRAEPAITLTMRDPVYARIRRRDR